jgi:acetyltransferase
VTLQPMITAARGVELLVGAKQDPVFGSVLLVGAGGVMAELLQDRALELPPLDEPLARRMLESLRCWPLLQGYRGRPGVDVERLIEVLIRFSYLVADWPELSEIDINPLLVTADRLIALDARMRWQPASSPTPKRAARPARRIKLPSVPISVAPKVTTLKLQRFSAT